ncbi:MAG TPA: DUF402 domain-containing protein [Bacillota bacterium]|nr:DUF402 domain-containing protein [Bacillota bacterium]
MNVPMQGSNIQIQSYKHDGKLHRQWKSNFILKATPTVVIGVNDQTEVLESDGRTWMTREPAILYFSANHWFNVIGMLRKGGIYYYCNMSSPFVYDAEALKYIDYDLDFKVYPDFTYELLDEDEYAEHKKKMGYPAVIDRILHEQMDILKKWIHQRFGPFSPEFVDRWYEHYLTYRT